MMSLSIKKIPRNLQEKLLEQESLARLQDIRSTHKNQLHFYRLTQTSQNRTYKTQYYLQVLPRHDFLGMNPIKYKQELYAENCKIPMKESKKRPK